MIKVIYGSKGTGKTKQIIDAANAAVANVVTARAAVNTNARIFFIFCFLPVF